MSDRRTRRRMAVAVGAAAAVAAGFAVTAGAGAASAAPGSVTWQDGDSKFTRTISDVNPKEGDIVTSKTTFQRTAGVVEYIYAVKDLHPTCLTYVEGSAKVDGSPRGLESKGADFARIEGSSIEWPVRALVNPNTRTFEFSYRVGADCARETPLMTTMHYGGSLGSGTYADKGPTVAVAKNATSTSLAAVSGVQVGQSVTLSATVSGAVAGDSVDFYDGATKVGTGVLNASGGATFAWMPSSAGAHSLQAKFAGTAKAKASESAPQSVSVSVATSMTVSAPASALTGSAVTLTATVTPSNAQGSVQFRDGSTNIGVPVVVSNGTATLQHTFDTAGNHSIAADFIAGTGFVNSSAPAQAVSVSVPDAATATTLTVPSTADTGAQVTLSADVAPNPGGGTVQFKDNGADIGAPVAVSNGKADLPYTFSEAGQHSITAVFSGAPGFVGSTSQAQSVAVSVPNVATTTTLTGPATAETGQQVTLTANLDPANASGSVQFKDGNVNIGNAVAVSNGKATTQTPFTTAGQHSITAVFTGNTGFKNSTSAVRVVTVSTALVQTSLELSVPSAAQTGTSVTLTATTTPADASGTVQFTENGVAIGGPVTVANGVAKLEHAFTAAGDRTVGATFTGASGFTNSNGASQTVQVSVPTPDDTVTTTTVTVPATATVGSPVTLSATVAGGTNLPGTVQFYDGDLPIGDHVSLVDGVANLEHTFTTDGAHRITARYSGGQGVKASASAEQSVQVTAADNGGTGSAGSLGTIFGSLGGAGRSGFGS
ncbi:Ig-like domain-containing protein [Rhodococcus sp. TAF43]|uniref:Ig-like domain-containing protein n=1 Tax=Rhodococcus sp. TAF43 TaxID=3237483 RepID=UPI003F9E5ECF